MKKKILLIILLALLGSIKVNAFTVAQIQVQVNNSQTGLSIASHPVIITDSAGFIQTYYTNVYGQFNDSVYNAATTPVKYYIITYDCNNVMHYDTVTTFGWVYKSANFNICNVAPDLGILEIINPGDTSFISGLQTIPVVKVKNFTSDTVSGIHFGYKINGQLFTQFFYAYDLLPNATNYFNLSGFTTPSSNFTFCAFLMNTDNNSANDTLCKTVVVANPYKDAGVVEVLTPLNSVISGDSVAPVVRFKNYGTNTLTSIEIGYRANDWGPFVTEIWTGNLPQNSTAIFTFNQKFQVSSSPELHFEAYTFLTGDQNWFNDSSLKIIPITQTFDAGVVQIIHPVTALAGDTIYPQIKIKNFGTQLLTSVPVRYKVNSQLIGNAICNLNIAPNSTVNYTFPQYFICPTNSFCIFFSTELANDIVTMNDTTHICIDPILSLLDVGVIDIINPADIVCTGNVIYPKVIIKNFGLTPLSSIPVAYQRGSLTPVTATWTGNPLNYGDTASLTFLIPFTVPAGSTFSISAYTNLANDSYAFNNKITKTIVIANTSIQPFNINGDDTIVIGQSNVIYQASINSPGSQYVWTLPPGAFLDSVHDNFITVHFANNVQSGNITCKIITPCGVTPTSVFPIYVFTTPPPPIINLNANHTLQSGYTTGNQWYFENNAIQGANSQTYTASQTGHYYCKVTINSNTSAQSNTIYVGFTGLDDAFVKTDFEVYPNPASDKLFFRYAIDKTDVVELKLMDIEGRCIKSILNIQQKAGDYKYEIDVSDMTKGLYFYQFNCGNSALTGKIIITK